VDSTSQPDGSQPDDEAATDGALSGEALDAGWSDGEPSGEGWSDGELPEFEPAGVRQIIPGCLVGMLASGTLVAVFFVGFMTLLSGLALEGCSFDFCRDECLEDPSPLVAAATAGDLEALEDARPQGPSDVATASRCALRFAHDGAAVALVAHGPPDDRVVREAAGLGAVEVVAAALEQGVDAQDVLDVVVGEAFALGLNFNLFGCEEGEGVERQASIDQQRTMVRAAVDAGADPDGRLGVGQVPGEGGLNRAEMSPLLRASFRGRADLVAVLLEVGADPDHGGAVDVWLIMAAQDLSFGSPTSSQPTSLPEDDAVAPPGDAVWPRFHPSPHLPDVPAGDDPRLDVTPLMGAATGGHLDVVELLLDAGADPDVAAADRFVALHAAAARGDRAMTDALLAAGASPSPVLVEGAPRPAETARGFGHDELADHLEAAPP
jgi:hypothetical protein